MTLSVSGKCIHVGETLRTPAVDELGAFAKMRFGNAGIAFRDPANGGPDKIYHRPDSFGGQLEVCGSGERTQDF